MFMYISKKAELIFSKAKLMNSSVTVKNLLNIKKRIRANDRNAISVGVKRMSD